jgi:hypothetical protein
VKLLERLFSRGQAESPVREMAAQEVRQTAPDEVGDLVEVEVVGEGFRQDALAAIAGPKQPEGKQMLVGATLRREPTNAHDANAVRVEVMGTLLGYVSRALAEVLSPAIERACGGILEARGMIVGGWRDEDSEGHYGIRVWITQQDAARLGLRADAIDWRLRPRWPEPPAVQSGERRLSPTRADLDAEHYGSTVTVTCEEHCQDTIATSMPEGWDPDRTWPLLVDLAVAEANPYTKHGTPCIEVRYRANPVGYFTPKMTERHLAAVQACADNGERATALGQVARGTKGGATIWRIKVQMRA